MSQTCHSSIELGDKHSVLSSSTSVTIDTTGFSESSSSTTPPTFSSHEFLPSYSPSKDSDVWAPPTSKDTDVWAPSSSKNTEFWAPSSSKNTEFWAPSSSKNTEFWAPSSSKNTEFWAHSETSSAYPSDPLSSLGQIGRYLDQDSNSSSNGYSEDPPLRFIGLTQSSRDIPKFNRSYRSFDPLSEQENFVMKPSREPLAETLPFRSNRRERHNSHPSQSYRKYRSTRRLEKSVSRKKNLALNRCFVCSDRIVMPSPVSFSSNDKSPGEIIYHSTSDITDIPTDSLPATSGNVNLIDHVPDDTLSDELDPSKVSDSSAKVYAKCCPKCCTGSTRNSSKSSANSTASYLYKVRSRPDLVQSEGISSNPLMAVSSLEEKSVESLQNIADMDGSAAGGSRNNSESTSRKNSTGKIKKKATAEHSKATANMMKRKSTSDKDSNRTSAIVSGLTRCDSDSTLYRPMSRVQVPTLVSRGCSPIVVIPTRGVSPQLQGKSGFGRSISNPGKGVRWIAIENDTLDFPKRSYSIGSIAFAGSAYQKFKIRRRLRSENSKISPSNSFENPMIRSLMDVRYPGRQSLSSVPPRLSYKQKPPSSITLVAFSAHDSINLGLPDDITPDDEDVGTDVEDV